MYKQVRFAFYIFANASPANQKDQLSILSKDVIQSIAPYLMEQKTGKVFGNWIQEIILLKCEITKQQIIKTVHKLEQNSALKLSSTKYVPAHFAQTQLGLQEISQLEPAPVYSVHPVDSPRPSPRRASGNRTPGQTGPASRLARLARSSNSNDRRQVQPRTPSAPRSRRDKFIAGGQRSAAAPGQRPRLEVG